MRSTGVAFVFRYPSPQFYVELSWAHVGVNREALEAFDASKQDALLGDLEDLVHRLNRSGDETMVVSSDYLEVVAVRRWGFERTSSRHLGG
ncbi:MAG: NYN domain-containing protein [Actinomycetota bacterium]|nr:NYN domain-containing protein [Actinomycetota bacterium]